MDIKDLFDESGRIIIDSDKKLQVYITTHHERFHNLLFWTSIVMVVNFIIIMIRIVKLYPIKSPTDVIYLEAVFAVIFFAFAVFLTFQWKAAISLGPPEWGRAKILVRYKSDILNKQAGLIAGYMITYTLILISGYIFYEISGVKPGGRKVLDMTFSISLITYFLGLYSLYKNFIQRRILIRNIIVLDEASNQKNLFP